MEFEFIIQIWIAAMLSVQSVILYKLLPLIKKMGFDFKAVSKVFKFPKSDEKV